MTGDYAADRLAFRTKLLMRAPAPQPHGMPSAPRGVREIDYPSGDLRLRAWIGLPAGAPERAPVVLFLHSGFAFSEEDWEMMRPFREAGYAVVMPSVRGENGQAGAFSMFFDEVGDVLAVTDYVRSQPWADPWRIHVAGHSAGGTLAMLAGLASPHYRALAPFSGSPDQLMLAKGLPKIVPFDRTDPAEYEIHSPLPTPRASRPPHGYSSAARRSSTGLQPGFWPRSRARPERTWRRWRWPGITSTQCRRRSTGPSRSSARMADAKRGTHERLLS
jgi:poly(3-hydroxybutyrate) depolymerase